MFLYLVKFVLKRRRLSLQTNKLFNYKQNRTKCKTETLMSIVNVMCVHGCTLALEEAAVIFSEATNVANCLTPNLLQGTQWELSFGFPN